MVRALGEIVSNKNLVEIMIMAALTIAGIFIVRQFQQVSAASAGRTQSLNITSPAKTASTDSSSADTSEPANADSSANNSSHTSLSVNGQPIEIPENGSVSQTVVTDNGTATVNAQSSKTSTTSQGGASNTTSSSVNINVRSGGGQ